MSKLDPRIYTSETHLRQFQYAARNLSFLPKQASRSVLNGRHASRLRGRGLNFEELRDYLPGDDIRSIDWKTTARFKKPYVRVLTEEKDRPVLAIVDQRMSMFWGSVNLMKSVTAAEAAAISLYIVANQGDRTGAILFNDDSLATIRPTRGNRGLNRILNTLSEMNQSLHANKTVEQTTHINEVLKKAIETAHHDHLVLILSDFDEIDLETKDHLRTLASHNDVIIGLVHDPSARNIGKASFTISDGLLQANLDLNNRSTRDSVQSFSSDRLDQIFDWQRDINLSVFALNTGEETLAQIRRQLHQQPSQRRVR